MKIKKEKYKNCLRCGRKLKNDEARERGYGKVCWEKRLSDSQQHLFTDCLHLND